jgi:hypothetical protein
MFDIEFWAKWKLRHQIPARGENPTGMTIRLIKLELIEEMERDAHQRAKHFAARKFNPDAPAQERKLE